MSDYEGEYIIIGPPGCGKTHRIAQSVKRIVDKYDTPFGVEDRTPVLVCSLTRTAAAEATGRVDLPRQMVGTLHSHAYRAIDSPPLMDADAISLFNSRNPHFELSGASRDTDEPETERVDSDLPGDKWLMELQEKRAACVDRDHWAVGLQEFEEVYTKFKREHSYIDFDDMIEMAVDELPPGDPKVIIADEAQDLSVAEFRLLQKWGGLAGALIVVGDPYQALYTWRGADPSFLLDHDVPEGHRDVLSQSYRVPQKVHAAASEWIKQLSNYQPIEYHPTDVEGEVWYHPGANYQNPDALIEMVDYYHERDKSVMIATACGYMLNPLLSRLREKGKPFSNPWRTKRGDWNPLKSSKGSSAGRLLSFLSTLEGLFGGTFPAQDVRNWLGLIKTSEDFKRGTVTEADQEAVVDAMLDMEWLMDRCRDQSVKDEFFAMAEAWGEARDRFAKENPEANDRNAPVPDLILDWLYQRSTDSRENSLAYACKIASHSAGDIRGEPHNKLYVGTIHSFKGAEADVVIVTPDLSRAGALALREQGDPHDSVIRMFYVALTRARETLIATAPHNMNMSVDLAPFLSM